MKKIMLALGCVLLFAGLALGQEAPVMFALYQSQVTPSKGTQYEDGVKKLKAACEQNNIDTRWNAFSLDDNSYVYSVVIKNFADLDKNPFAALEAKIGKEAHAALWNSMDQCVESQSSSVIVSLPNYSYLASTAEDSFRDLTYWFVAPDKEAEAEKILMEWKQLHEAKKDGHGYTAFKVIFGAERGYAIMSWGKNLLDWATKRQKSNELLGADGDKLWAKTMSITRKYYSKKAWFRTDLRYNPPAAATK